MKSDFPPSWPHKIEKSAQWTVEEKERVLEALSELPEELWDSSFTGIYRLKRSKDHPNPSSYGGSMIVLYDSAFNEDHRLPRILAHELAHHRYEKIRDTDEGVSYRKATGWHLTREGDRFVWTGRKNGYSEVDGVSAPKEDFSNNIEHFLFERDKLKEVTPTAYMWIRKQFSDKFKIDGGNVD